MKYYDQKIWKQQNRTKIKKDTNLDLNISFLRFVKAKDDDLGIVIGMESRLKRINIRNLVIIKNLLIKVKLMLKG